MIEPLPCPARKCCAGLLALALAAVITPTATAAARADAEHLRAHVHVRPLVRLARRATQPRPSRHRVGRVLAEPVRRALAAGRPRRLRFRPHGSPGPTSDASAGPGRRQPQERGRRALDVAVPDRRRWARRPSRRVGREERLALRPRACRRSGRSPTAPVLAACAPVGRPVQRSGGRPPGGFAADGAVVKAAGRPGSGTASGRPATLIRSHGARGRPAASTELRHGDEAIGRDDPYPSGRRLAQRRRQMRAVAVHPAREEHAVDVPDDVRSEPRIAVRRGVPMEPRRTMTMPARLGEPVRTPSRG